MRAYTSQHLHHFISLSVFIPVRVFFWLWSSSWLCHNDLKIQKYFIYSPRKLILTKNKIGRKTPYDTTFLAPLWKEIFNYKSSRTVVFLKMSRNSQESTCARVSFLIKLQVWGLQLYLKKRLWYRCFPVNVGTLFITLFISFKKLFSLSRYSNFCISVFPSCSPSAIALEVDRRYYILKFMTLSTVEIRT